MQLDTILLVTRGLIVSCIHDTPVALVHSFSKVAVLVKNDVPSANSDTASEATHDVPNLAVLRVWCVEGGGVACCVCTAQILPTWVKRK